MFQGHSRSRSRPEGVSLSARALASRNPSHKSSKATHIPPRLQLRFLTTDPGMSMKTKESGLAQTLLLNVCDAPKVLSELEKNPIPAHHKPPYPNYHRGAGGAAM